jgi:hypothetical protein
MQEDSPCNIFFFTILPVQTGYRETARQTYTQTDSWVSLQERLIPRLYETGPNPPWRLIDFLR